MATALEQSASFPMVRAKVRELLTRNPAFRQLDKDKQRELAHDMVKVASYIVGGETGDNVPSAVELADTDATSGANLPDNIPQLGEVAGADFTAAAAQQGGQAFTDLVNRVNFPEFVAGLIDGVFTAIVDASIKQMEAYSDLLKNVVKSVEQYMKDNVSENQARDQLADRYPDFLQVDITGDQPQLTPAEDYDEENLPDFFADLGLASPVEDLDEDVTEQILVPAARRRIAMDRQQMLATMVMMGINRIVVTDGKISASVLFRLRTEDTVTRGFEQTAEQAGGKYHLKRNRPGWFGWFSPSVTRERESSYGRFSVSTTQEEDSESTAEMHARLAGKVDINFRSETFPLERMADVLQINQIQQRVPGSGNQPPTETTT